MTEPTLPVPATKIIMPAGWKMKIKAVQDNQNIGKSYLEIRCWNEQDSNTACLMKVPLSKLIDGAQVDINEMMAVALGLS